MDEGNERIKGGRQKVWEKREKKKKTGESQPEEVKKSKYQKIKP